MNTVNINRLLENSQRSDVWGYNIYSRATIPATVKWAPPSLGFSGYVSISHEIDTTDILIPKISLNGQLQTFTPLRNHWTPAFVDTYYRSAPTGEYTRSGLLAVRERKCFTENDVFVSHLTFMNDSREPMEISLSLAVPYPQISDSAYQVESQIRPSSLAKNRTLKGFLVADFSHQGSTFTLPPQSRVQIRYGFAFSVHSAEAAQVLLCAALAMDDPFTDSEKRFNRWMSEHAPVLEIENTDLLKVYYYRFFVMKCAIHEPSTFLPGSDYEGQCAYESPFGAWFGAPIGLPVPLQIEEMKWMRNPAALRSHIKNWSKSGMMQYYIQFTPMAIWHSYLQTGDRSILTDFYDQIRDFTLSHVCAKDKPLRITHGSWITGAEYQPSFYQHKDPPWDWRYDREGGPLGFPTSDLFRVDDCVMNTANLLACKHMAQQLHKNDDVALFSERVDAALAQIKELFWNPRDEFFFDFDPVVSKQCDKAYSYDGFTPLMFGLFGSEFHSVFNQLKQHGRFDGEFSITSIDKECPMYWFDNCITGPTEATLANPHYYGCSWNGPIWPYAVSLVLEALGYACAQNRALIDTFHRIFADYTELHFANGDRSTPSIREHYRPSDCTTFSSNTEYFHSEWINLFISYYLGIRVTENGIDFSPTTKECFVLNNVYIQGKNYRFAQEVTDGNLVQSVTELP